MSLNKYMHPRNMYKVPPNFKQLAIDYPEFRAHIQQDVSGKVSIDFKDAKALRALSYTLLKKDFNLDVNIPLTKMIPTIPLRLNYILWLEDLLSISGDKINVKGIDIGTGASCIYPLLAAKKNSWTMIATDIDTESVSSAQENVSRNSLAHLITVKQVNPGTILKEAIGDDNGQSYDFCMCNPPFFTSTHELNPIFKARKLDRPRPRNAFCAAQTEVVAEGGEVKFVSKLIEESKDLDKRIKIYTSMVGQKSNLPQLKKLLREMDVISFKQTEFYQGHTTRWALAWTYHDIDLRAVPQATLAASKKEKPQTPLVYTIPAVDKLELKDLSGRIKVMLTDLDVHYEQVKESKNVLGFCITAQANTWSHQRRKRRKEIQASSGNGFEVKDDEESVSSPPGCKNGGGQSPNVLEASEMISQMNVHSPKNPSKRELEEDGFYSNCKRLKLDVPGCYLKGSLILRKSDCNFVIELLFTEGTAGKEGMHQVLQYIKNNLKLQ